jgi:tRNA (guanine-N7-)-methyltransferase
VSEPKTHTRAEPDALEYLPENYFAPVDATLVFSRGAPLEVDVGCGEGAFIVAMAVKNPAHNFLGIERLLGRVRKVCRRSARAGIGNVRLLRAESFYVVKHLLAPESVSVFHVMFPDPWPKRKHHRRRLINREFLDAARAALRPGGEMRLTTDDADYFRWMQKAAAAHEGFAQAPWPDDPDYPQTDFERRFRALGLPIHRLLLRKI